MIVCSLLVNFAIILPLLPRSARNRKNLGGQIEQELFIHTLIPNIKIQQETAIQSSHLLLDMLSHQYSSHGWYVYFELLTVQSVQDTNCSMM
jgi:hypothetical protein